MDCQFTVLWRFDMFQTLDALGSLPCFAAVLPIAMFYWLYLSNVFIVGNFFVPNCKPCKFIYIPLNSSQKLCRYMLINRSNCGAFWSSIGLLIFFWSKNYLEFSNRGLFSKIHPCSLITFLTKLL